MSITNPPCPKCSEVSWDVRVIAASMNRPNSNKPVQVLMTFCTSCGHIIGTHLADNAFYLNQLAHAASKSSNESGLLIEILNVLNAIRVSPGIRHSGEFYD